MTHTSVEEIQHPHNNIPHTKYNTTNASHHQQYSTLTKI